MVKKAIQIFEDLGLTPDSRIKMLLPLSCFSVSSFFTSTTQSDLSLWCLKYQIFLQCQFYGRLNAVFRGFVLIFMSAHAAFSIV